jgi:hypothetical protein
MDISSILLPYIIFYGHFGKFLVIFGIGIFPRFGVLCREKSGNPDHDPLIRIYFRWQ